MNLSLLVLLFPACVRVGMDDSAPAGTDTDTVTEVVIDDPTLNDLVQSSCAAVSSTMTLTFNTPKPTTAVVEFGPTTAYGFSSVPSPTALTTHYLQIPGFPLGEEWHWRVTVDGEDGPYTTADYTFTGGAPPSSIPSFDVERVEGEYTPGFRTAPGLSTPNFVMVMNDDGDPVWWTTFDSPLTATQARFNADGSGITYMVGDQMREQDLGAIIRQDWCGESVLETRTPWSHHDYIVLDDGTYVFPAADIREADSGVTIVGDTLTEIQPDGSGATAIWSTWDHLDMNLPPNCEPEFYPQGCDWTHANNVDYDADLGTYYFSFHETSSVAAIDRNGGGEGSGTTRWIAGGPPDGTLTFADEETEWTHQHGFKHVGGGEYLVFDNGPGGTFPSEARRVAIDERTGVISTVWNYVYDERHTSQLLGDIHLLPSGNYYIGWGSEAELTEVTPDKEIVWKASAELGVAVGFSNFSAQVGGEVPQ